MTETIFVFIGLICLILFGSYIGFLFNLGQSRKRNKKYFFYFLVYVPVIISLLFAVNTSGILGLIPNSLIGLLSLSFLILERIAWAITLREVAHKDELVWFLLVFIFPFMWVLYRVVNLR